MNIQFMIILKILFTLWLALINMIEFLLILLTECKEKLKASKKLKFMFLLWKTMKDKNLKNPLGENQ